MKNPDMQNLLCNAAEIARDQSEALRHESKGLNSKAHTSSFKRLITAVLGTALSAVGCTEDRAVYYPESWTTGTGGGGGTGGAGGSAEVGGEGGSTASGGAGGSTACVAPEKLCGGVCVNIENDNENCGDCGNTCEIPLPICMNGECTAGCQDGFADCYDHCVETSPYPDQCSHVCTDITKEPNCGGCGVECPGTTTCKPDPNAPGSYKCQ